MRTLYMYTCTLAHIVCVHLNSVLYVGLDSEYARETMTKSNNLAYH